MFQGQFTLPFLVPTGRPLSWCCQNFFQCNWSHNLSLSWWQPSIRIHMRNTDSIVRGLLVTMRTGCVLQPSLWIHSLNPSNFGDKYNKPSSTLPTSLHQMPVLAFLYLPTKFWLLTKMQQI